MSLKAEVHISHPRMVLGSTLSLIEGVTVRPDLPLYRSSDDLGLFATVQVPEKAGWVDFDSAVEADETVASAQVIAEDDNYRIYDFTIAKDTATLFTPEAIERSVHISDVWNDGDMWANDIQAPDRACLSELVDIYTDRGATIRITRLYSEIGSASHGARGRLLESLTDRQKEALVTAFECGYYNEPRDCSLADVGEELGISSSATGRRLRRGTANLLEPLVRGTSD